MLRPQLVNSIHLCIYSPLRYTPPPNVVQRQGPLGQAMLPRRGRKSSLSGNSVAEIHLTRAKSDGVRNCLCPQARLRARVREQDGYWATQLCTSMSS
jgi:hypothetical protein